MLQPRILRILTVLLLAASLVAGCASAVSPGSSAVPAMRTAATATAAPSADGVVAPASAESTPLPSAPAAPGASASPAPTTASPSPSPSPSIALDPAPRPGPFTLDLFQRGDFVAQYTDAMCVPASMQMMINLMDDGRPDRSRRTQDELYQLARSFSSWLEPSQPGAGIQGWIGGLEQLGHGDFEELAEDTLPQALRTVARQMRLTNKPAGLWVWHGEHAWVVSGFKATADPAYTDDFRVTAVWIEDPWSGRVSRIWGPGLEPHTLISAKALAADYQAFSSRHRPQYGAAGKYVIIAPIA